jgi:hypothetical protein
MSERGKSPKHIVSTFSQNRRIGMGLYRTCFFGKAGLLPGCQPIHAGSDMDARRLASDLLRDSPDVESVEVWRDADLVLRMNRHQMRLKPLSWNGDLLEGKLRRTSPRIS